jgi:glycosyl hydrolase family 1
MIFLHVTRIHFSIGSRDQPSILIPVVNMLSTIPQWSDRMQRRQLLQSTLALAGASHSGSEALEVPVEFPKGFRWGAASSSHQTEGAVHEDGRCESVWDRFSHTPGVVKNDDNGDIACDSYHRYKDRITTSG